MDTFINAEPVGEIRREETDGKEFLVAPVTFIKSMNLHRGYVPKRQIEKATDKWPGTPLVADHPKDDNGQFVSINHSDADRPVFGFIDNTETKTNDDAETEGEVWINVNKAEELGGEPERIKDDLADGRTVSVSAAYGGTRLPAGEYDGKERDKVIGNLRPDHVALLRNREGRCSITDGCMAGPNAVAANDNVGLMLNAVEVAQNADDPVSPEDGQGEADGDMTDSYNALQRARRPEYDGTTTASWSAPTFTEYVEAFGWDADNVDDLNESQKRRIAELTLLGNPSAETLEGLRVFPVVEPDSRNLSENALIAVLGGRGAQADIPERVLESARSVARSLLEEEFDRDISSNAGFLAKLANILGSDGVLSGNESADTDDETVPDMGNKTETLVEEHGFNADNLPDEDTECFNRIYENFVANDDGDETDEEGSSSDEQTTDEQDEETTEETEPAVTFDTEEDFEEAVAEVVDDRVDEALAANEKRNEKSEIVDDIIANSDDHDDDDRETLMESPKSVLQTLKDEVSSPEPTPDFGASRGVSANQSDNDSDGFPALSASERMNELEGDD